MDQRRLVLFLTLSMGIMLLWSNFVVPPPKPVAPDAAADQVGGDDAAVAGGEEDDPQNALAEPATVVAEDASADGDVAQVGEAANENVEVNPTFVNGPDASTTLGSLDPDSGYFMEVGLSSRGASIASIRLNHPRYKELEDRSMPLQLIGDSETQHLTMSTAVDEIDVQLREFGTSLEQANWTIVGQPSAGSATFRFESPDGMLEVEKTYRLTSSDKRGDELKDQWNSNPAGYQIACDLVVRNKGVKSASLQYELQGPVGLRLENEEHARKFRDVPVGFLNDGQVDMELITAAEIYKQYEEAFTEAMAKGDTDPGATANRALEVWQSDFKYIGVDVQFFAALLVPLDDRPLDQRAASPRIAIARPMLIQGNPKRPQWSDVSVRLTSAPIAIEPGEETTHKWLLYAGPKREELLAAEPMGAADVLQYGWFGFVAKRMLSLLSFLHGIGFPYYLAIITMTIMVRGIMFPLSRKQALGAKKMKDLQPKIQELKNKYGDDREKMARAQMELFRKNKYNPFSGCLPMFIQLPIFIGLYTALNAAVDLRLGGFLWVDNLAAPDKLFKMPFELPFLGSDFNLLPLITVVLFLVQQKMFMPPPTDEQQEMQQKMMNFMTIFMGFLFWHVPAGLCVYFIASSLWGVGERKMLDFVKTPDAALVDDDEDDKPDGDGKGKGGGGRGKGGGGPDNGHSGKPDNPPAKPPSVLERLLEAANASDGSKMQATTAKRDKKSGNSKKKGKNKSRR